MHVKGRELYVYYPNGMARPKIPVARIEKLLERRPRGETGIPSISYWLWRRRLKGLSPECGRGALSSENSLQGRSRGLRLDICQ